MARDDSPPGPGKPARPNEPIDLATSVAGEEDPGAAMDLPQPASRQPPNAQAQMAPGDEAPAGTPSSGESVCPQCGGTGRLGASSCPNCLGTGKVIVGIGGA